MQAKNIVLYYAALKGLVQYPFSKSTKLRKGPRSKDDEARIAQSFLSPETDLKDTFYPIPKSYYSIIDISPPRCLWSNVTQVKKYYFRQMRAGPHISFVDPFIEDKYYDKVIKSLQDAFADFEPFKITIAKLGYFGGNVKVIYGDPQTTPANAFARMYQKILQIVPQCNDQITRFNRAPWKFTDFSPHLSIAKVRRAKTRQEMMNRIAEAPGLLGMSWICDKIILMRRNGKYDDESFENTHVIKLGGKNNFPELSRQLAKKEKAREEQLQRTLLLYDLPLGLSSEHQLHPLFAQIPEIQLHKIRFEFLRDSRTQDELSHNRRLAVMEFPTAGECNHVLNLFQTQSPLLRQIFPDHTICAKKLEEMAVGDIVGGSYSFTPWDHNPFEVIQSDALMELDAIIQDLQSEHKQ
eukprot:TRINITY_DN10949_c0_g1_i2.p1 TRINITY_DN10949_c0_g1~~TRINITY_DN10949_c0_g1_i2.p1  ORF type:complete len:409 (+),score=62.26 TRINITY_DN10949_c0_g1_i2:64-1290(+)